MDVDINKFIRTQQLLFDSPYVLAPTQGKCWKKRKEIANSKFAITTISKDKEDTEGGIATFHDVMLVRSISIGKG